MRLYLETAVLWLVIWIWWLSTWFHHTQQQTFKVHTRDYKWGQKDDVISKQHGWRNRCFQSRCSILVCFCPETSQTQVYKTHLKLALTLNISKIINSFLTVNLSLWLYSNKMGHINLPLTAAAPPTEAVVFFDFSKPMTLVSKSLENILLHPLQVYSLKFFVCRTTSDISGSHYAPADLRFNYFAHYFGIKTTSSESSLLK